MKKYIKEVVILLLQLCIFYIYPLFVESTDVMGMVFLIFLFSFILSVILGSVSKEKRKYLYPVIIAILFLPSVYIYYNDSALIYSVWHLIISYIGLGVGIIVNKLLLKNK